MKQGYSGTKSPLAPECHQYYPSPCQAGPVRAFPDVSDAWPCFGPNVSDVLAANPAMPPQAPGMPAPFDYGSADSGGSPIIPMTGSPLPDGSTVYVPDTQTGVSAPSNIFASPVPGSAGYPYEPGLAPGGLIVDSSATPLDQMAGSVSPLKWPWSVAADYNTPAAPTPDAARYTTLPAGPSTFLRPMPSITPMHGRVSALDAYAIEQTAGCRFAQWVDTHRAATVVGMLALYFVLKGAK